jgi:hypothetical protein
MLELAAKAAGYFFAWNERFQCLEVWTQGERTTKFWQPHRDDGDAFRLGVKLRIKHRFNEALGQGLAWLGTVDGAEATANIEECGRDECATLRLAIVRAAAAIVQQHDSGEVAA